MATKIAHLTSVHPRYDTRIFLKMCRSLASAYDVTLVVADGIGDEIKDNVSIVDVGIRESSRIRRMMKTVALVYKKAVELDADIYHLHDPELLPVGKKLKNMGKVVVFDSHEDVPVQMLNKPYLSPFLRKLLAKATELYEKRVCLRLDFVIAATPFIRDKFVGLGCRAIDINNYPSLADIKYSDNHDFAKKARAVCYVGGLARVRGIETMIASLAYTNDVALNIAGMFSEPALERNVKAMNGWEKVNELGFLDREGVNRVFDSSMAGLVVLKKIPNYLDALPVKMFEYMAAGIPVIASDIALWKKILEENQAGICVDPDSPETIGSAIQYLVDNPNVAQNMGRNGRRAVEDQYSWEFEEKKLIDLYKSLLPIESV